MGTVMNPLLYTLIALAVVAAVVWIGWRLFQFAHRKAGEESERGPVEAQREDWPWSNPS
jgi:threonine/homoserine/homoserine lactone efflux protein